MRKLFQNTVALCLLCVMLLAIGVSAVCAPWEQEVDPSSDYEKHYSTMTIEDEFAEDEVIVCIFPDWHDKEYTPEDFAEINCISVEVLMKDAGATGLVQILLLKIADGTKQKVLDAVRVLEAREDIKCADPNGYAYPDTGDTVLFAVVGMLLSCAGRVAIVGRKKNF